MCLFSDLPDDVLHEILGHLPALDILSYRRVCRNLNRVTNDKSLWINIHNRTRHMLRPQISDNTQVSRPELEKILGRAEILDRKWHDKSMHAVPRRGYRVEIENIITGYPVAVMGDYVVFGKTGRNEPVTLQWRTLRSSERAMKREVGPIEFEYTNAAMGGCVGEPHFDHALRTFRLIFTLKSTEGDWVDLHVVSFEIGARGPRITTEIQIPLMGRRATNHSYLEFDVNDRFICAYQDDESRTRGGIIVIDVLNLQTRSLSRVSLKTPYWMDSSEVYYKRKVHIISETLLILTGDSTFIIYGHPNWHDEHPLALPHGTLHPTRLRAAFSDTSPSVVGYRIMPRTSTSFAVVGLEIMNQGVYYRRAKSRFHLYFVEFSGLRWSMREIDSLRLEGSSDISSLLRSIPTASFSEADYALGVLPMKRYNHDWVDWAEYRPFYTLYATRLDISGSQPGSEICAIRMPLEPLMNHDEEVSQLNVVSFDPFGGRVFLELVSMEGARSLVVLDCLARDKS